MAPRGRDRDSRDDDRRSRRRDDDDDDRRDRRDDDDDGGGYKYRGRDRKVEDVVRHSKSSGSYDSIFVAGLPGFKPKEGENCIRILPPTWTDDEELVEKWGDMWDITIRRHFNIGPDSGQYLCLKMTGPDCPVCDARRDMDKDEADEIRAGEGRAVWLIDRNDEKAGPQIWAMPKTKVFDEIISRSIDKKTKALIHIDDPEEGYDVVFEREGTGDRTNYAGVDIMRDPCPIHDDEKKQKQWMKFVMAHPLPECLNFFEEDYIESVLRGKRAPKADKDEDEGRDSRSSRSRGRGRDSDRDRGSSSARRRPLVDEDDKAVEERSERGGRRSRRDEPEEEESEERAERASRPSRRGRDEPEEEEEEGSKRETRPTPRGGRSSTPTTRRSKEDEDAGEGEEDLRSRPRRAARDADDDKDKEEEEPKSSRGARKGLDNLRKRASK